MLHLPGQVGHHCLSRKLLLANNRSQIWLIEAERNSLKGYWLELNNKKQTKQSEVKAILLKLQNHAKVMLYVPACLADSTGTEHRRLTQALLHLLFHIIYF